MGRPALFKPGDRVGNVTVVRRENIVGGAGVSVAWRVACDCGREHTRISYELKRRGKVHCECQNTVAAGKQFGPYTAIEPVAKGKDWKWRVRCICGMELTRRSSRLHGLANRVDLKCCIRHGPTSNYWKGKGAVSGRVWGRILRGAGVDRRSSGALAVSIDLAYIADLFERQGRRCALTGIELNAGSTGTTASLDRIDNTRGYEPGNVRWVHRTINMMKRDFSDDVFVAMCKAVAAGSAEGLTIPEHRSTSGGKRR